MLEDILCIKTSQLSKIWQSSLNAIVLKYLLHNTDAKHRQVFSFHFWGRKTLLDMYEI